ncbi:glutamine-rich protein 2 [Plakobranchus ocellatus]|uniref:Glutamine-rich protein 2 n=1 Tax=Plakobranchus ocellatus TaxID=259542 RepID=A0AAV4AXX4_9GAST|nr:glutamine-rich protein 2 [Plakobranchus ocellatus]
MVRYGTVRCGAVRCGAVRCGVVRYGTVRYGMVRYGMVWYAMLVKTALLSEVRQQCPVLRGLYGSLEEHVYSRTHSVLVLPPLDFDEVCRHPSCGMLSRHFWAFKQYGRIRLVPFPNLTTTQK